MIRYGAVSEIVALGWQGNDQRWRCISSSFIGLQDNAQRWRCISNSCIGLQGNDQRWRCNSNSCIGLQDNAQRWRCISNNCIGLQGNDQRWRCINNSCIGLQGNKQRWRCISNSCIGLQGNCKGILGNNQSWPGLRHTYWKYCKTWAMWYGMERKTLFCRVRAGPKIVLNLLMSPITKYLWDRVLRIKFYPATPNKT